ncbi:MAG TPA: PRC-barrel domain-containing protein [Lentibacillus sp.]|uniref:PRC-barrel domain-containing protein n=1 Tax=Lentibacillus sp. TaxID=1925746 RepID=UPI002B4B62FE|nr:PRC-barrel domain-containing protein [Lentibacillus sp.]HLR62087.1 PRC-barrel domain-containing protein [Lentibacillus sp.]
MLYFTTDFSTYHIEASDGPMGKIQDLYFDDKKWVVRYAVLDSRRWLPSRRVLLSPAAFKSVDNQNQRVDVEYDKETVRNSPSIPADATLSKDMEMALTGYYGWSRYWLGGMLWGVEDTPLAHFEDRAAHEEQTPNEWEHNLRSSEEVTGYRVHANDGKIGESVDLIIDDSYWRIHYLAIKSDETTDDNQFYLIKPENIQSADWVGGDIYVDKDLAVLKNQTSFESQEAIIRNLQ